MNYKNNNLNFTYYSENTYNDLNNDELKFLLCLNTICKNYCCNLSNIKIYQAKIKYIKSLLKNRGINM